MYTATRTTTLTSTVRPEVCVGDIITTTDGKRYLIGELSDKRTYTFATVNLDTGWVQPRTEEEIARFDIRILEPGNCRGIVANEAQTAKVTKLETVEIVPGMKIRHAHSTSNHAVYNVVKAFFGYDDYGVQNSLNGELLIVHSYRGAFLLKKNYNTPKDGWIVVESDTE